MLVQSIPKFVSGNATFLVAASDASPSVKARADYVCDGTADDVQIQAAIDALPAYGDGGSVILSAGNFNIAASINIRGALRLKGQGVYATRLNLAANCDMLVYDGANPQGFFYLEYMFLNGDSTHYSGNGLVVNDNLWDVYLTEVFFGSFSGDAIITDESWGWEIVESVIEWCSGNAFVLNGAGTGPKIANCKFIDNEKHAILLRKGGSGQFTNCELRGLRTGVNETKVYAKLTTGKDISAWAEGDVVRNDTGDGDDWTGTVFDLYTGDRMTNAQVIVQLTTGTYATIDIADGIENTTKADTTTLSAKAEYRYAAICFEGDGGNATVNNCRMGLKTNGVGVRLDSPRNVIVGNHMYNGHTGVVATATHGGRNVITDNMLYNQSSMAFEDGEGTSVVKNNQYYVTDCSEIIDVTGDGSATTITLNHDLDANGPKWCDRIFQITPASAKMAASTYWISSITSSQIVITFSAALELNEHYIFHINGFYQNRVWNLSVP